MYLLIYCKRKLPYCISEFSPKHTPRKFLRKKAKPRKESSLFLCKERKLLLCLLQSFQRLCSSWSWGFRICRNIRFHFIDSLYSLIDRCFGYFYCFVGNISCFIYNFVGSRPYLISKISCFNS